MQLYAEKDRNSVPVSSGSKRTLPKCYKRPADCSIYVLNSVIAEPPRTTKKSSDLDESHKSSWPWLWGVRTPGPHGQRRACSMQTSNRCFTAFVRRPICSSHFLLNFLTERSLNDLGGSSLTTVLKKLHVQSCSTHFSAGDCTCSSRHSIYCRA